MQRARVIVAALTLSAAGLVGIVSHEGYTDRAVQPLPGDKWTYGYGMTMRDDGTPVQPGDRTTPQRALVSAMRDLGQREQAIRQCLGNAEMHQHEWDFAVDFAYNVGIGNFCGSTMAELFRGGQHEQACRQALRWTMYQGKDCKDPANKCGGLVERRRKGVQQCLGQ